MHCIYIASMYYKLFWESKESWHVMREDNSFFTRACESYIFIEGVTFSVYFLDALEQVKYFLKYFCMFGDSFNWYQTIGNFIANHLCMFFPSIPLTLSLMDWLLHRVPSDPWKKPVQCHLKSDESRAHRIIE